MTWNCAPTICPLRCWFAINWQKARGICITGTPLRCPTCYGNTAQFVGSVGDAFSAICCWQIFRFTSSKPSKSAIASDEKFIRLRTNSFVRYCPIKSRSAGTHAVHPVLRLFIMLFSAEAPSRSALFLPGPAWAVDHASLRRPLCRNMPLQAQRQNYSRHDRLPW